jgi:aspartyl-tRNA(Asn)/glutamyl-tRNA(Gln) amidotransferase subunit C
MPIDKAEVRRIARLAHLEYPRIPAKDGGFVDPPELLMDDALLEKLAGEIGQILDHIKQLDEVNVEGVEPTSHGVPLPTAFREDEANPGLATDRALDQAPQRIGDAVAVPRIVE